MREYKDDSTYCAVDVIRGVVAEQQRDHNIEDAQPQSKQKNEWH